METASTGGGGGAGAAPPAGPAPSRLAAAAAAPAGSGQRVETTDHALERAIETLLGRRRPGATICPSEAARAVASGQDVPWRPLVALAREAAGRLADQGRVEILQSGQVVDVTTARGPVRIRRAQPAPPRD